MGWKIIFAPQAIEQLEQIVRYIAQDDPSAADRFANYLVLAQNWSQTFLNWERRIESDLACDASYANLTSSTTVFFVTNA